jgi:hypothetical protein
MSLCGCGCGGEVTAVYARTNHRLGHVIGAPCHFLRAHNALRPTDPHPTVKRLRHRAASTRRRLERALGERPPPRPWRRKPVIPPCPWCGMRRYHRDDRECYHSVALSVAATTRKKNRAIWDAWVCPPCPLPGPGH